ncbi:hypothetical protein Pmani_018554, partial [Petrolisthes manimaculis]
SITGPAFKGYFVQARDKRTDKWVGHFEESKNSKVYPECSAITHGTVPPKTEVYLTWVAPKDGQTERFISPVPSWSATTSTGLT